MSREITDRTGRTAETGVTGVVVVAHGGRSISTDPVSPAQLTVLRMVPLARAIRHALRGTGVVVRRPRFQVRGWNGEQASPVPHLRAVLDQIGARFGDVPVVLVGHSMGARAALRAAGHPAVTAVAGLAPWLPPGEPVEQLAGRRILLAHGTADRITRPADTWLYAERARTVTEVTAIEVRGGEHAMLRRVHLWHRIAEDFCRESFGMVPGAEVAAGAFRQAFGDPHRTVL
jgi:pimeloyl-ACP methyl ester carboxylesterase